MVRRGMMVVTCLGGEKQCVGVEDTHLGDTRANLLALGPGAAINAQRTLDRLFARCAATAFKSLRGNGIRCLSRALCGWDIPPS